MPVITATQDRRRRTTARPAAIAGLIAAAGLLTSLAFAAAPADRAARTEKGGTLVVPEAHAKLGTVYYVHPGRDAQVTFISDAPLEHIKGTTSKVVGYMVLNSGGAAGGGPRLVAGQFNLPINSFETGIPMRNEHLQSARWMDSQSFPDVVFAVAEVNDVKVEKQSPEFTTYSCTLVGDMTVKATTKEMSIPARFTLLPASDKTRTRAPGDMMAIRCEYNIKLSDFGVNDQAVGLKVSDEMTIDTALFLSTVSPDTPRERPAGGAPGGAGGPGSQRPAQDQKPPEKPSNQ